MNSPIRIGVLAPADIAFRRFMPALSKIESVAYAGVAIASQAERVAGGPVKEDSSDPQRRDAASLKRADAFVQEYKGPLYDSCQKMLDDPDVDAIYLPLPPSLHFPWGKAVLEAGKHLFMEKPFTTSLMDTQTLLDIAQRRNLAVHENYMFAFHDQISFAKDIIASGRLGEVRLIRIDFGFPFRGTSDFRYMKMLGGGALLDCAGYTLKLADILLGESVRVVASSMSVPDGFEVDVFGSATLENGTGTVAQVAWGMDNDYRCDLDVWGSKASLHTGRILTAPAGFSPSFVIHENGCDEALKGPEDDSFKKSIKYFLECVSNKTTREMGRRSILHQAVLVQEVAERSSAAKAIEEVSDQC